MRTTAAPTDAVACNVCLCVFVLSVHTVHSATRTDTAEGQNIAFVWACWSRDCLLALRPSFTTISFNSVIFFWNLQNYAQKAIREMSYSIALIVEVKFLDYGFNLILFVLILD